VPPYRGSIVPPATPKEERIAQLIFSFAVPTPFARNFLGCLAFDDLLGPFFSALRCG
jgi:hypothetical protein